MNTQSKIESYNVESLEKDQYSFDELYIVPLVDQSYIHIYNDHAQIKLLTVDENDMIKAVPIESLELQMCLMNYRIEWNLMIHRMHKLLLHQDFSKPSPRVLEQDSLINYMKFFHYFLLDQKVARKMFGYTCFHSSKDHLLNFINGVEGQERIRIKTLK